MKKAAASRKRKQEEDEAAKEAVVAKRYEKNQFQTELNAHDRRCSVAALEKILTRQKHSDAHEFETDPATCATRIEKELFKRHKSVLCEAYDEQLRSILFNLQKEKNATLRAALLRGAIQPAEFVAMKVQDLANPDLVALRDSDAEWAKTVAMAKSLDNLTQTTAYTCRKCGNNMCRMAQLQLRSADEPMTTFVSCNTCGHRWQN